MMIGQLFLVLAHPSLELVGQRVDRGVHVAFAGQGMNGLAADVQRRFGLVLQLLDGQHEMRVDDVIEVSHDAVEFLLHVAAHGCGDLDVMTGDAQLHELVSLIVCHCC